MSQSIHSKPNQLEKPSRCIHVWTAPRFVTFTSGVEGAIRDCSQCGGYMHPCTNCDEYHLVDKGRGGKQVMPAEIVKWDIPAFANCSLAEEYLQYPVPVVRRPPYREPPTTYWVALYIGDRLESFRRRWYYRPPKMGIGFYSVLGKLPPGGRRVRLYYPPIPCGRVEADDHRDHITGREEEQLEERDLTQREVLLMRRLKSRRNRRDRFNGERSTSRATSVAGTDPRLFQQRLGEHAEFHREPQRPHAGRQRLPRDPARPERSPF